MATVMDGPTTTAMVAMPAEANQLSDQALRLKAEVDALAIADQASLERAGEMAKTITLYIKRVGEVLDPICDAAHKAWKTATEQRRKLLDPAEQLKKAVGERMAAYIDAQQRRAREAEEAAQRERERLEREAEEEAAAEAARLRAEEEDRRLAEAAEAEARGDTATAERLISAPIVVAAPAPVVVFTPPPVVQAPAKIDGISTRITYAAKCVNLDALIKAAAAGDVNAKACLMFDPARGNSLARSLKEQFRVPGVELVRTGGVAVRA